MAHLGQGLRLDLADSLSRDLEVATDLVESRWDLAVEPVPHDDDGALAVVEAVENDPKIFDVEF